MRERLHDREQRLVLRVAQHPASAQGHSRASRVQVCACPNARALRCIHTRRYAGITARCARAAPRLGQPLRARRHGPTVALSPLASACRYERQIWMDEVFVRKERCLLGDTRATGAVAPTVDRNFGPVSVCSNPTPSGRPVRPPPSRGARNSRTGKLVG